MPRLLFFSLFLFFPFLSSFFFLTFIHTHTHTHTLTGVDDGLPTLAEFFVEKHTPKHDRPVTRRLVINEETILERDVRTYGVVTLRPLTQVFALVQSWEQPQRLAIEYVDGTTVWCV